VELALSLMGDVMKQLQFDIDFGGHKTPSFSEWYQENCTEKRKYNEPQYTLAEGKAVYKRLIENNFFKNGGYTK
jgi:hypothetical protein